MAGHDIIVIGASAGGIEALTQIIPELPADLPASILIVEHFPSGVHSVLPDILNRASSLPAHHARDREPLEPGRIYIAPPDQHLLVKRGYVRLIPGPRENGLRPAVDPMFRTAARAYGPRVVGVILSGNLDDGTFGLKEIKARNGVAIVQDPNEATYPGMPENAIRAVDVDFIVPIQEIPSILVRLAHEEVKGSAMEEEKRTEVPDAADEEADVVERDSESFERGARTDSPSILTCPECGGILWELEDGNLIHYRCHVGHRYSIESLLSSQRDDLEAALWASVRALEENASLARRLYNRSLRQGQSRAAERFALMVEDAENRADLVRRVLLREPSFRQEDTVERDDVRSEIDDVADENRGDGPGPAPRSRSGR